jgi:hypothetical protein
LEYEALKNEVKEIAEIASSLPEAFQVKCFELLLTKLIDADRPSGRPANNSAKESEEKRPSSSTSQTDSPLPMQAAIRVFMERAKVSLEELRTVVLAADGEIHFVREPCNVPVAQGQIEWALLLALRNAFLKNSFAVDPEDVRSICQEKGFYDAGNFATTFKKAKNAALFANALEPQGPAQTLSNSGQDALGKLIKSLAGTEE